MSSAINHKSGPSNITGYYRGISITNTMYYIFSGIINTSTRLYNIIKLMNPVQVFVNAIQLLITFSAYKKWLKSIYLKGVIVFIVSTSISAKRLINLTIIEVIFCKEEGNPLSIYAYPQISLYGLKVMCQT